MTRQGKEFTMTTAMIALCAVATVAFGAAGMASFAALAVQGHRLNRYSAKKNA